MHVMESYYAHQCYVGLIRNKMATRRPCKIRFQEGLIYRSCVHNFEDKKFANFFNLEQVNFRVTLVNYLHILIVM